MPTVITAITAVERTVTDLQNTIEHLERQLAAHRTTRQFDPSIPINRPLLRRLRAARRELAFYRPPVFIDPAGPHSVLAFYNTKWPKRRPNSQSILRTAAKKILLHTISEPPDHERLTQYAEANNLNPFQFTESFLVRREKLLQLLRSTDALQVTC